MGTQRWDGNIDYTLVASEYGTPYTLVCTKCGMTELQRRWDKRTHIYTKDGWGRRSWEWISTYTRSNKHIGHWCSWDCRLDNLMELCPKEVIDKM